ncbi:MAG: hypothetical protein IPL21_11660 [Saprospirales bacterium]|nr:hypothetical protein [Saprospirales bacterium]
MKILFLQKDIEKWYAGTKAFYCVKYGRWCGLLYWTSVRYETHYKLHIKKT